MGTGCALWTEGGGRVSPRRARYFSLLRQRKVPKRKAPHSLRPCASLRATCGARSRGAPWNSLRADALRSDNPGELDNEACVSCGTHATPRPVLLGAARWKGGGIRAIAALGPQHAAERSDGPCGLQPPSGCAEERRGWRIRARDCLSAAGASSSETPPAPSTAGCPGAARRGRRQRGRFLLPSFLGETRKEGAPPGAHPGLRPWRKHHIPQQSTACTVPTAAKDAVCAKCPRDVKNKPNMPITLTG